MGTDGLRATEAECADGRSAPRVSLADIEANIVSKVFGRGTDLDGGLDFCRAIHGDLDILTICLLTCRNGFIVIGKSAPAHRDNFDPDLGRKLAYEDAVRQLWPLMGYALRERLAGAAS